MNWHLTVAPELAKTRGIQLSKGEGAQSAYRITVSQHGACYA